MSLEENRKVTINGDSKIDGVVAERYGAIIDEENPEQLSLSRIIVNAQLRKDNKKQCRKDQAQFEDDVYEMQDEMIQQDSVKGETA